MKLNKKLIGFGLGIFSMILAGCIVCTEFESYTDLKEVYEELQERNILDENDYILDCSEAATKEEVLDGIAITITNGQDSKYIMNVLNEKYIHNNGTTKGTTTIYVTGYDEENKVFKIIDPVYGTCYIEYDDLYEAVCLSSIDTVIQIND